MMVQRHSKYRGVDIPRYFVRYVR